MSSTRRHFLSYRSSRWLAITATALALWAPAPALQTAETAFGQSLIFRADRVIVDPTHPAVGWLAVSRPEPHRSTGALRLRLMLRRDQPDTPLAKDLGETVIFGGNLAEHPVPINVNLTGVPDGDYEYVAEINDGSVRVAVRRLKVKLVSGLDEQHAATERRLAKIAGHDSAKASIRYPFDLARVINLGRRMLTSSAGNPEFGLKQNGEPVRYDFAASLARSATLLASLERGADPVWRQGGEAVRHYYMSEADEILPYHVFVPSRWNGTSALPLVFILHGNSRDQDFYFERDERIIPRTADRHGYMVVAPLGYSPNAGYNYVPYGRATSGPRGLAGAAATSQVFGPADETAGARGGRGQVAGFGGVNGSVTPAAVRSEWSEQDAIHVLDLIRLEYPIDARRVFLFGYSAGGQGAHYLGPKYSQHWTAIAIGGSNAQPADAYPYDRLKQIPVLIFCGNQDEANLARSRTMAAALQQHGVPAELKEYAGATHDTAPSAAIADIFTFFDRFGRK